MQYHKEIVSELKKISTYKKEFINLESKVKGNQQKKNLSYSAYCERLLNFDGADLRYGIRLKRRIATSLHILSLSKPDFTPSYSDKSQIEQYIKALGKSKINSRIKEQLELLELLEVKKQFSTIDDVLDDEKTNELKKYLKRIEK